MMDPSNLRYRGLYTKVPADPSRWRKWEEMGKVLLEDAVRQNRWKTDRPVTLTGGEKEFPRRFQLLEPGGTLVIGGISGGGHFTFMGKKGTETSRSMLEKAGLARGERVLIYYGVKGETVDSAGLDMIESAVNGGGRIVVAVYNEEQQFFLEQRSYHHDLCGVVNLEEIRKREGAEFDWPPAMPYLPDPERKGDECEELLQLYHRRTIRPFAAAVARCFGLGESVQHPVDLVMERAGHDALGVSTALIPPRTGRVVYCEDMSGRRYSFYGPRVQQNRLRIEMPSAAIVGMAEQRAEAALVHSPLSGSV